MSEPSYHHGDLKSALVVAAREQIALDGADSLNLRALARGLGVTHPAVYRHFTDKHALLVAVAEEGFTELAQVMTESLDRAAGSANKSAANARLHSIAAAYLDFAMQQPKLTHVMFALISAEDRNQNEGLYAASKRCFELLVRLASERDGDPKMDAITIWATIHGYAQLVIEEQVPFLAEPEQRDAILARAVDVLGKGLQT